MRFARRSLSAEGYGRREGSALSLAKRSSAMVRYSYRCYSYRPYSYLKVSDGSSRAARRAGT